MTDLLVYAGYMGVPAEDIPSALEAYQALSAEHRELVFETIGDIGGLTSEYNITNFVSGPIVTDVSAAPVNSADDGFVADADELSGLSVQVTFSEEMDVSILPTIGFGEAASNIGAVTKLE